jgi:predicted CoA-binding protein
VSGALVEDEAALTAIARTMKTVAVVGIKDGRDPDAPAFNIPELLIDSGVRVIGVNPVVKEAFGQPTLGSLAELREAPDLVDVFRRSDAIPELTDQLLALPAELRPAVVWLQSGIRHDESAARLVAAGYRVVQDRCLGVYRRRAERGR